MSLTFDKWVVLVNINGISFPVELLFIDFQIVIDSYYNIASFVYYTVELVR